MLLQNCPAFLTSASMKLTSISLDHSEESEREGWFSGSGSSDDPDPFATFDPERDPVQDSIQIRPEKKMIGIKPVSWLRQLILKYIL